MDFWTIDSNSYVEVTLKSLAKLIKDKESNEALELCINKYFPNDYTRPPLIRSRDFIYQLFCKLIHESLSVEATVQSVDVGQLSQRSKLLAKLVYNYREYQLNLLLVLCDIKVHLGLNDDVFDKIVEIFHTNGVISEDAFSHWFQCRTNFDRRVRTIKSFLQSLKTNFFINLTRLIEDKESNETLELCINKYFGNDYTSLISSRDFIYQLFCKLIRESLSGLSGATVQSVDVGQLTERSKLLANFVDNYPAFEMGLLSDFYDIKENLELNDDVFNKIVKIFHTNGIISIDVYTDWFKGKIIPEKRRKISSSFDKSKNDDDGDGQNTEPNEMTKELENQLSTDTKKARKSETERLERLIERLQNSSLIDTFLTTDVDIDSDQQNWIQHKNDTFNCVDDEGRVLINIGHNENEPDIYLTQTIAQKVMAHQIGGIRFLYDNIIESIGSLESTDGYGCILTHAMGLGKTVQIIALVDIFMRLKTEGTVLIVMPVNTLKNWMQEFDKWLPVRDRAFNVVSIDHLDEQTREHVIIEWKSFGGVLLIGYETYLSVSKEVNEKIETNLNQIKSAKALRSALVDVGPHLVICDEGHRIKNDKTAISRALKKIRTSRRVILTGTPLQNRLKEYYIMIDFVRPHYLGDKNDFIEIYEIPIKNGQFKDSDDCEKQLMRERSHELNQLLKGFIQRRNEDVLKSLLPDKKEFVLFCKLSAKQRELLEAFLNETLDNEDKKMTLFNAFGVSSKICSHPDIIQNICEKDEQRADNQFFYSWAQNLFSDYEKEMLNNSNKFVILFDIIDETVAKGDRLIIFSQWLFTLDFIERFLELRNVFQKDYKWKKNENYYRFDGQTKCQEREQLIKNFNSENNKSVHLFLISTKAGGIGINLIGANRIVIFDACWNPCHDAQASCRIFRPGQSKPCFIYRLISDNSLEKRVFNKQVFKQGMFKEVVDQQNTDLKLNEDEVRAILQELREELAKIDNISYLDENKLRNLNDPLLSNVCRKSHTSLTSVPFEWQTMLGLSEES